MVLLIQSSGSTTTKTSTAANKSSNQNDRAETEESKVLVELKSAAGPHFASFFIGSSPINSSSLESASTIFEAEMEHQQKQSQQIGSQSAKQSAKSKPAKSASLSTSTSSSSSDEENVRPRCMDTTEELEEDEEEDWAAEDEVDADQLPRVPEHRNPTAELPFCQ
jgi:hypothetical protein